MDKNAIKSFAIESRRQMIESVKYQASLIGITAEGINEPISKADGMETYDFGAGTYTLFDEDIQKRENLVKEVKNKGFDNVVEEVAYTWFNRIIAIRFMEVNDYLPTRTRVLSSEIEGKIEPDIITEALELDLDYSSDDKELILKLKDENELDELFQFLFIKQCNNLNNVLPGLFDKTDDYMEILLNISFTNEDGIIRKLINDISEKSFENQVEIIGWFYQYYISEKKAEVIDSVTNKRIVKEDIPAATQLFTPNWIVKYMVDNSLGKYWIERNSDSKLNNFLEFFIDEANQHEEISNALNEIRNANCSPEDISFLDPCMGSGHILVYAFDIFMEIYKEKGYIERDIPQLILENNLFGLDIDDRAYQLAYFSLMMKARKYDRRIFYRNVSLNILSFNEGKNISEDILTDMDEFDNELGKCLRYLIDIFNSAKEFGSLIQVQHNDYNHIEQVFKNMLISQKEMLSNLKYSSLIINEILQLIKQAKILSMQFEIVVTNPPYMNKFEDSLKKFAREFYKDYSRDLFSMFLVRNVIFCKPNGYCSFMTPRVWMYLQNFEKLRKYLLNHISIASILDFEFYAIWEIAHVSVCAFIFYNNDFDLGYKGNFFKLSDFKGGLEVQKEKTLEAINNNVDFKYNSDKHSFFKIPRTPIIYWLSDNFFNALNNKKITDFSKSKAGVVTGNDKYFVRFWFEVNHDEIIFHPNNNESYGKYHVLQKGGLFRKYYGNNEYVIKLHDLWDETKCNKSVRRGDKNFYFKKGIGWSQVASKDTRGFRIINDSVCGTATPTIYIDDDSIFYYVLAFLNSNISREFLSAYNSTVNLLSTDVSNLPLIIDYDKIDIINYLTIELTEIAYKNWNNREVAFNFNKHPLIGKKSLISESYIEYNNQCLKDKNIWINNEKEINCIFNKIYDLEEEMSNQNSKEFVTLLENELIDDIKSFISYAVGCMFGRYSLDNEGIQFAGGTFDLDNYSKFKPDDDNIIPVLDTEYFEDDIVGRFVEFVKVCFGEETLEENLNFIAGALKKKGKTSREIIRNYLLNDFYKDHLQMYKKCPIYWQFDSGKQNAFKCLVYMHRYEPGLVARVRTDYLHKTQKAIEQNLSHCDNIIANSSNKSEITKATKDRSKYIKQLDEIKVYDEALGHVANQHVEIDLDDGVKVNYAKFQKIEISKEGEKTKKINLLKNI